MLRIKASNQFFTSQYSYFRKKEILSSQLFVRGMGEFPVTWSKFPDTSYLKLDKKIPPTGLEAVEISTNRWNGAMLRSVG